MDTNNLKGLMEAYSTIYAPQEVDEAVKGADTEMRRAASTERRGGDRPLPKKEGEKNAAHMARKIRFSDKVTKAKGHLPGYAYAEEVENVDEALDKRFDSMRKRGGRSAPPEERSVGGEMNRKNKDYWADTLGKGRDRGKGSKAARRVAALKNEELDIFDVVLEFLQVEGFAETLEEAQEIMANELDADDIEAIVEATYSAKAARAGKDIGKPGKAFAKIAASAGKRYGSKERGEKVAGAVLAKLRAKRG